MKTIFTLLLFTTISLNISSQCLITDLVAEPHDCDMNDQFLVDVDFDYAGVTDSFEVRGNGNSYGFFSYDNLPVTIGPLDGNCDTNYEVVVIDQELEECNADTELGVICCGSNENCLISNLTVEVTDCNEEGEVNFIVNFDVENPEADQFTVAGNGNNYGSFAYSALPITIGPIEPNCELSYELVVYDNENDGCNQDIEIGEICCELNCEIGELDVELSECDDNGNVFAVINFEYANVVSNSFVVAGNGNNYGTFEYSSLPITVGPIEADCETELELVVFDSEEESCASDIGLGVVCCGVPDCLIDELIVTVDCDVDGLFGVFINFIYESTSDSFEVVGNGNNYGTYAYGQLPVFINGLEADCETVYEFGIVDQEIDDCGDAVELGEVCCDEECGFGELEIELTNCSDADEFFVEFDLIENEIEEFTVYVNGVEYGSFVDGDLPIILGPFDGDCETQYLIDIVDDANESCSISYLVGPVCCNISCELGELITEYDCNEDEETFDISIDLAVYSGVSDSFEIVGNGNNYGTYAYGELPIVIFGLSGDCELDYEFILIDQENEECSTFAEVGEVCCGENECEMGELIVEYDCNEDEETFDISINISSYSGVSDSFIVVGNGNNYGTFAYIDLPITLFELEANCELEFEFIVVDTENEACKSEIGLGTICCNGECFIGEISYEIDCHENNESFTIFINFEYEGTGESFSIFGNGNEYGSFLYDDLPISIEELEADCDTEYEFEIIDNENEECFAGIEVGEVCCGENCELGELLVEYECNDDEETFDISIGLSGYSGVSDSFMIVGNGNNYGTFAYSDLPILLSNLEADCELEFEFAIVDTENEECQSDIGLGSICCTELPCNFGEIIVEMDCTSDDLFNLYFNLEGYEGLGDSLSISYENINLGNFAYADLPLEFEDLPIFCEIEVFVLTLTDTDDTSCSLQFTVLQECCNEECFIGEFSYEIDCHENEESFTLFINFEHDGTGESFSIFGNGNEYGSFQYDNLPIGLEELEADCETEYEFEIIDDENEECFGVLELGEVCCEGEMCDLGEIVIETDCTSEELYDLYFNLPEYEGVSDSFELYLNGIIIGIFNYEELPVNFEDLPSNCDLVLEFTIVDLENEDCFEEIEFGPVCCTEEQNCTIEITGITDVECIEGEVSLRIDFESNNIDEPGIDVAINGDFITTVGPESQFVEIEGYMSEESELLVSLCQSEEAEACCDDFTINNPCFMDAVLPSKFLDIEWSYYQNIGMLKNASIRNLKYKVFSYTGAKISVGNITAEMTTSIDLNHLSPGIYVFYVYDEMVHKTYKFVVE